MTVALDEEAMVWSRPAAAGGFLVLFLHGHHGVEHDMTPFFDGLPSGTTGVSIRGPVPHGDRWTWYDHLTQPDDRFDAAALGVLAWLDTAGDFTAVGAVGFSQGGALAVQVMRHRPGALAFAVEVCGFVRGGPQPGDRDLAAVRPPVLSIVGGRDDVVDDLYRDSRPWLRRHTDHTEIVRADLDHRITDRVIDDTTRYLTARIG